MLTLPLVDKYICCLSITTTHMQMSLNLTCISSLTVHTARRSISSAFTGKYVINAECGGCFGKSAPTNLNKSSLLDNLETRI